MPHILDYESFGNGKRRFYFDLKKTRNQSHYIRITRSDTVGENLYQRTQLVIYENDLPFFVEALSMLLYRYTYRQLSLPLYQLN